MSDLVKLKSVTEDLTVLYVEDSSILLKRMSTFLEHLFKKVYQAVDGKKGLESYKHHKPDIVITDLNMPVMSGHEMIKNIKELDSNANIIVVSAYSDTGNLLESIHLGVVDFVPKPVDSALLQDVLLKIATKVAESSAINDSLELDDAQAIEEIFKKLHVVYKSHNQINFINHYKGVPILNKGVITAIDTKSINVEVPFFQALAIKYEGKTVLDSELFDKPIEAKLEKVNGFSSTLKLYDLQYLNQATMKRKQLSVEVGKSFSALVKYKDEVLKTKIEHLSKDFISLIIDNSQVIFSEGDPVLLEFEIQKTQERHSIKPVKIITHGEVYTINKYGPKEKNFMVLFELDEPEKSIIESYIENRRLDLVVEFKQLNRN